MTLIKAIPSGQECIVKLNAFEGSKYLALEEPRQVNHRTIYKYALQEDSPAALDNAVATIKALLRDNSHLCATFPTPLTAEKIRNAPYLTINGRALCIFAQPNVDVGGCTNQDFIDKFFTESFLKEPIQCNNGHWLEKENAKSWCAKMGGECPVGGHKVDSFFIDTEHQRIITQYLNSERKKQQERDVILNNQRILADRLQIVSLADYVKTRQNADLTAQLARVNTMSFTRGVTVVGAVGKITTMLTVAEINAFGKIFLEMVAPSFFKSIPVVLEKIPVLSLFIGLGLAGYRMYHKEWAEAGLELAAGIAACVPVAGTIVSIGLSAMLVVLDVWKVNAASQPNEPLQVNIEHTLEDAYRFLGITSAEPTREEVTRAWQEQTRLCDPNRIRELGAIGDSILPHLNQITITLRDFKDAIFRQRRWEAAPVV